MFEGYGSNAIHWGRVRRKYANSCLSLNVDFTARTDRAGELEQANDPARFLDPQEFEEDKG